MRFRAVVAGVVLLLSVACGSGRGFFTQYEYEEETYLSLDGSATVYVNASVTALNALRGSALDANPDAVPDKSAVASFFTAHGIAVERVTFSHRNGRRYVHVRMDVDDVRQLGATRPFAWSTYTFTEDDQLMIYRQRVGVPAAAGSVSGLTGDEIVAFRLHIPSKVPYHNAGADNLKRGNILVWEQPLRDRLAGQPIEIDARMETQSILYRTLALFGFTIVIVAIGFAAVLWWIVRVKGRPALARHNQRAAGGGAEPVPGAAGAGDERVAAR